jgi:hypothetical protein
MKAKELNTARREAMVLSSHWLIAGAVVSVLAMPRRGYAAKAAKADFFYQEKPKDGKSCATCRLFVPLAESGKGSCAIVDGDVSPTGWCMAYSPRA